MKLHSSGTSATLTSMLRASASAWTNLFSSVFEVAAITRKQPSRSEARIGTGSQLDEVRVGESLHLVHRLRGDYDDLGPAVQ